tara:strand:+ start:587 stop:772 length:186 start_codon:yes stop_codon:yes gene_type:complete
MNEDNVITAETFLRRKVYQVFKKYTYGETDREELHNSLTRLKFSEDQVDNAIKMKDEELRS